MDITPETPVHRVGGCDLENLRLKPRESELVPPGFSVILGGTPQAAAATMREALPQSRKWRRTAGTVASTTVAQVRDAGFDVIDIPSEKIANHGRLIHAAGAAGFSDDNLRRLAALFIEAAGF